MAWGIFNKIKRGIKKAFKFVKDKIVKPVVDVGKKVFKPVVDIGKKVLPIAAPIMDKFKPGLGMVAEGITHGADTLLNGDIGGFAEALRSGKIRLK